MPIINDFYAFIQYHFLEIGFHLKNIEKINSTTWYMCIFISGNYDQYIIRKKLADLDFYPLTFIFSPYFVELNIKIEKI